MFNSIYAILHASHNKDTVKAILTAEVKKHFILTSRYRERKMMAEVVEVEDPMTTSIRRDLESDANPPPPVSAPPARFNSCPSLSDRPLLLAVQKSEPNEASKRTPRARTPIFLTPLGSPIRRAIQMTKLNAHDAWLPITESRNGNMYYAAFHTLCSGIGIQALVLPVALTILGWYVTLCKTEFKTPD